MATKKKAEDKNALKWHKPGAALATVFFTDEISLEVGDYNAINVSLMPCFEFEHSVSALIGDSVTSDDIMDVNDFENVFSRNNEHWRFVSVALVNRSPKKRKIELAFLFNGQSDTDQRYVYEIESNGSVTDQIDVILKN